MIIKKDRLAKLGGLLCYRNLSYKAFLTRGAVAALGINYKDLGIETGKIVGRVLKGEKPGTIKPITMNKLDLYLSPKHAQEVGITLPQDLISQAAQVEPAPKAKQ